MPVYTDMKFVTDIIPKNTAVDIALNAPISIKFGRDINPITITGSIIVTKLSNGARINGSATYQVKNAVWVPVNNFEPGESYQVAIMGDHGDNLPCIVDIMGNKMPSDYTWTFRTTTNVGILAPVLIFPTDESFLTGSTVRFSFGVVEGATHYEIKLSKSISFESFVWGPMIYSSTSNTTNNVVSETASGPLDEAEYFWKVRAWVNDKFGPWSEVKNFKLNSIPDDDNDNDVPATVFQVNQTSPIAADYQVLPDKIVITFNENINPSTVNVTRFYITSKDII